MYGDFDTTVTIVTATQVSTSKQLTCDGLAPLDGRAASRTLRRECVVVGRDFELPPLPPLPLYLDHDPHTT
jgi:hypothetical protein